MKTQSGHLTSSVRWCGAANLNGALKSFQVTPNSVWKIPEDAFFSFHLSHYYTKRGEPTPL